MTATTTTVPPDQGNPPEPKVPAREKFLIALNKAFKRAATRVVVSLLSLGGAVTGGIFLSIWIDRSNAADQSTGMSIGGVAFVVGTIIAIVLIVLGVVYRKEHYLLVLLAVLTSCGLGVGISLLGPAIGWVAMLKLAGITAIGIISVLGVVLPAAASGRR